MRRLDRLKRMLAFVRDAVLDVQVNEYERRPAQPPPQPFRSLLRPPTIDDLREEYGPTPHALRWRRERRYRNVLA